MKMEMSRLRLVLLLFCLVSKNKHSDALVTVKNDGRRLAASFSTVPAIRANQWKQWKRWRGTIDRNSTVAPDTLQPPPLPLPLAPFKSNASAGVAASPAITTVVVSLLAAILIVGSGTSSVPAIAAAPSAAVEAAGGGGGAGAAGRAGRAGGAGGSAAIVAPPVPVGPAPAGAAVAVSSGSLEEREASQADTRNANYFSEPHPEFAAGLLLHWLLWAYSSREVALAYDFVGIAGLLYDGLDL